MDVMITRRCLPGCVVLIAALMLPHFVTATDIETVDGRRFSNCSVLKADSLGLYFRHRNGIARVLYNDLSDDLLAKLEPLPEAEKIEIKEPSPATPSMAATDHPTVQAHGEFRLVFRQRVVIGIPNPALHRAVYGWPARGAVGAHRYSHFGWRQAAERDFLITSGILPRPAGVVTRCVARGIRLNYF